MKAHFGQRIRSSNEVRWRVSLRRAPWHSAIAGRSSGPRGEETSTHMIEQPPNSQQWQVINRYIVDEFRNSGGGVKGQFEVAEILLLNTNGRKSWETRV